MDQLSGWQSWLVKGGLVLVTVFFALASPRYVPFIKASENWASDYRLSIFNPPREKHSQIVILAITEDTLATLPYRSPVDRGLLAVIIEKLVTAKAKVIGLDILFDQPTEAGKDERLRKAMAASPVPIVVGWTDRKTGLTERQYDYQKSYLAEIRHGFSNLFKDPGDGTVRFLLPGFMSDGGLQKSFTGELATVIGVAPPKKQIRIAYHGQLDDGTPPFPKFPAHIVKNFPNSWFEGKIVLVGADLPFGDRHRTPFATELGIARGTIPGVEIQAHMLSQILEGKIEDWANLVCEILFAFLLAVVAVRLTFSNQKAWVKALEGVSVLGLFWVGAVLLFEYQGVAVPMISPTLSFATLLGAGGGYLAYANGQQARFIKGAFSRYLSPDMVSRMADEPDKLRLGGERRDMTLLFCDVRGFTSLSERLTALELTTLLNRMLTPLTDIILANKGTIDKYMGDCIMAFWNAPLDNGAHARDGCVSALLMLGAIDTFNATLESEARGTGAKHMPLKIGFGLNSGECVVGNMGSEQRFDYSVLGDTVNTAARLEGQSKAYGVDIVIGEMTQREVPELATLELDLIQVKGKARGVTIYALLGDEEMDKSESFRELVAVQKDLLAAYRSQEWVRARELIATARELGRPMKLGELYDMYIERISAYERNPPSPVWDGVYIAETK
jgi:adenylate cyclase